MSRPRMRLFSRAAAYRVGAAALVLAALGGWGYVVMVRMPGKSFAGPLPPLTPHESTLRGELRRDVVKLAEEIGERNLRVLPKLATAADFVDGALRSAGYTPARQSFLVHEKSCENIDAELRGDARVSEIVVVGAHYDSVTFVPGADDNATGVAAMLALSRAFAGKRPSRTLRFVAFANEEPPHFQTDSMGSLVYARRSRASGEHVVAMLSLESIGYYSDAKGSQKYPPPLNALYPSTGNFIAFVGDLGSRDLLRQVVGTFRGSTSFPSEGAALPAGVPGVGWSDHWAFWQVGYPGVMVTDTAPFRNPHYHTFEDTPDKLDFDRMARVVAGLERVVADLVGLPPPS